MIRYGFSGNTFFMNTQISMKVDSIAEIVFKIYPFYEITVADKHSKALSL